MQQSDVAIDPRDSNLMQGDYLQVEAQARCMLKATTSSGFAWPQRATFDCQDRLSSLLHKAKSAFVHYATPKGMVEWFQLGESSSICRQRRVGTDALVVEASCFKAESPEILSKLPGGHAFKRLIDGYEKPSSTEWELLIFSRTTDRPIKGRLLVVSD